MRRTLGTVVLAACISGSALATDFPAPYNQAILDVIKQMPAGGGYDTSATSFQLLKNSMSLRDGHLEVSPEKATPSFCSSSTYLVFLKLISNLQSQNKLSLTDDSQKALLVDGQADGSGVWGRWNANGPGTARLFYELDLGANFTNPVQAKPGDFMKAFWSDEIGAKERGHSVVFTGIKATPQGREICFWSSQKATAALPAGMGEKCLPESKFRHVLFSRLQSLENLNKITKKIAAGSQAYSDKYLAALLKRSTSVEEMCAQVGCRNR